MKKKKEKKNKKKIDWKKVLAWVLLIAVIGWYLYDFYTDWKNGQSGENEVITVEYHFRNDKLLTGHYEKHGIEMGFKSKEAYEKAASEVVNNPKALHKKEAEDNDDVYYIEKTGEIVFVSGDGYIRTYFTATKDYYNRQ